MKQKQKKQKAKRKAKRESPPIMSKHRKLTKREKLEIVTKNIQQFNERRKESRPDPEKTEIEMEHESGDENLEKTNVSPNRNFSLKSKDKGFTLYYFSQVLNLKEIPWITFSD